MSTSMTATSPTAEDTGARDGDEPAGDPPGGPPVGRSVNPSVDPSVDPSVGSATYMAAEPAADPAAESAVHPAVDPAVDPAVNQEHPALGRALSPSRASDFMQCPLLYRFRVVDRLPEPPSPAALRGTVVHAVLERLFDAPAQQRTVGQALALLEPEWQRLRAAEPDLAGLFAGAEFLAEWLGSARTLLERYFTLEDPTRLEPAERELYVETELDGGLLLRGYVDRLDVSAQGDLRVVDYKSSRAPSVLFEGKALFQMKFYALVLWRTRGVVPAMLQLVYLGSGEVLRYRPDEHALRATERKLQAIWGAIERAAQTGDWRASPSRLCDWCHHRALCPTWGGIPPPLPPDTAARAAGDHARRPDRPGQDEDG